MTKRFYSNGKLLISGEYLVLDGATAFSLPTTFGQDLVINRITNPEIQWKSVNEKGNVWFSDIFQLKTCNSEKNKTDAVSGSLSKILMEAKKLNPDFLSEDTGYKITTKMDFPQDWGLGSSSTLINNIAQWAAVDPFKLLDKTFGGSGYDIAAAQMDSGILYTRTNSEIKFHTVKTDWNFTDKLFFVHLNRKQNSRTGISHYRKFQPEKKVIQRISDISIQLPNTTTLEDFEMLIQEHEALISKTIQTPTIQNELFPDYRRSIKSLGAWGGDFILATGNVENQEYFKRKGFTTVISFKKMIKQNP